MLRRLTRIAAVVSLICVVAMSLLWVRSCWRSDYIYKNPKTELDQWTFVQSVSGHIEFGVIDRALAHDEDGIHLHSETISDDSLISPWGWETDAPLTDWKFFGFEYYNRVGEWTVLIPDWMLLLAGLLPTFPLGIVRVQRFRRSRRRSRGLCVNCGYDIRHSSDCCSECGAVLRKTSTAE